VPRIEQRRARGLAAPLRALEPSPAALAVADAHGDDAVAQLAALHLVGDGADQARAGRAERVVDRDRAAS
jgi:hypothetical protein